MPNKDANHDIVVRALKKAGWEILKEHQYIVVGESKGTKKRLFVDIKVRNISQAIIILIEVKDLSVSPVHELMEMIGQYMVYTGALELLNDTTPLYIAIPEKAYKEIIQHPLTQKSLRDIVIPLLIYNPDKEELIEWIPKP
jgi:hypothetical protein